MVVLIIVAIVVILIVVIIIEITHPPLPGMHPTKVGCCLKKRGHGHRRYVVFIIFVLIVVIIELSAFC